MAAPHASSAARRCVCTPVCSGSCLSSLALPPPNPPTHPHLARARCVEARGLGAAAETTDVDWRGRLRMKARREEGWEWGRERDHSILVPLHLPTRTTRRPTRQESFPVSPISRTTPSTGSFFCARVLMCVWVCVCVCPSTRGCVCESKHHLRICPHTYPPTHTPTYPHMYFYALLQHTQLQ